MSKGRPHCMLMKHVKYGGVLVLHKNKERFINNSWRIVCIFGTIVISTYDLVNRHSSLVVMDKWCLCYGKSWRRECLPLEHYWDGWMLWQHPYSHLPVTILPVREKHFFKFLSVCFKIYIHKVKTCFLLGTCIVVIQIFNYTIM